MKKTFLAISFKRTLGAALCALMLFGNATNSRAQSLSTLNRVDVLNGHSSIQYLEFDIEQGLEFVVLDKKNLARVLKNIQNGLSTIDSVNYTDGNRLITGAKLKAVKPMVTTDDPTFGFFDPRIHIEKESGGRTIEGVWWGGIIDDVGTGGNVAASTKATTSDAQSKASVRPGYTAAWYTGGWKDTGVISNVMKDLGVGGNKAKWDLR